MQSQSQASNKSSISENLALKTYEKNVREEIRSIQGNLDEILKLLKFDEERRVRGLVAALVTSECDGV